MDAAQVPMMRSTSPLMSSRRMRHRPSTAGTSMRTARPARGTAKRGSRAIICPASTALSAATDSGRKRNAGEGLRGAGEGIITLTNVTPREGNANTSGRAQVRKRETAEQALSGPILVVFSVAARVPDPVPPEVAADVCALHGGPAADLADVAAALGVQGREVLTLEARE